jgi:hypothetical protein
MVARYGPTDDDSSVSSARLQIKAAMLELPNASVACIDLVGTSTGLAVAKSDMFTGTGSSISRSLPTFATRSSPPA